ncbi:MAG TPA: hypothetical protein VFR76_11090, partial [Verrucomicrobiae bacterium]|nr:hypothetical protein [Verrucomicrobiae bacterium]
PTASTAATTLETRTGESRGGCRRSGGSGCSHEAGRQGKGESRRSRRACCVSAEASSCGEARSRERQAGPGAGQTGESISEAGDANPP